MPVVTRLSLPLALMIAACGTSMSTVDGGADGDAGALDDATFGDERAGFDSSYTPYDGPVPVGAPCNPPCAADQFCYLRRITGGRGRAPFADGGATDGGDAGDSSGSSDAGEAGDASVSPGCYPDPPACDATPTCACVLAQLIGVGCDRNDLTCESDALFWPTVVCTLNLP